VHTETLKKKAESFEKNALEKIRETEAVSLPSWRTVLLGG